MWQEGFGYLDADGWQALGGQDLGFGGAPWHLHVAGRDDIWADAGIVGPGHVLRFIDGAWQRLVGLEGTEATWQPAEDPLPDVGDQVGLLGLGPDGTAWLWDADTWSGIWALVRFDGSEWSRWSGGYYDLAEVAPDGSVWSGTSCDGVGHFDGVTWGHYLPGLCAEAIDITADGAVWLLASEKDGRDEPRHLYVITPEAGAATE